MALANRARRARAAISVSPIVSDRRMRALNRQFRGKDKVTDVLSFPAETARLPRRCRHCRRRRDATGARRRTSRANRAARPGAARFVTSSWLRSRVGRWHDGARGSAAPQEGRTQGRIDRASASTHALRTMTPLLLFLLGCAVTYLGTVSAAFNALMRLSLRIHAERTDRDDVLGQYLEDPRRLFIPARMLISTLTILAAALLARVTGVDTAGFPVLALSIIGVVLACEHLIPLLIVRQDPERVLDVLLPSFDAIARVLKPLTYGCCGSAPAAAGATCPACAPTRTSQAPPPVEVDASPCQRRRRRVGSRDAGRAGARAAAQPRRLPRNDGARGDDAAARHHRDRERRDHRTAAHAVPRAAVFAHPGVQGDARQRPGLRLHQGPDPARARPQHAADRSRR